MLGVKYIVPITIKIAGAVSFAERVSGVRPKIRKTTPSKFDELSIIALGKRTQTPMRNK
jgi:hypothetical protein